MHSSVNEFSVLADPLGYVMRGIIKPPRRRLAPLSAAEFAEVEETHRATLARIKAEAECDEHGDPRF